jgi:ribonuclease P protein component
VPVCEPAPVRQSLKADGPRAASGLPPRSGQDFRFPADRRLKSSRQFDSVYRQGKRYKGKGYTIIVADNNREASRLGISVQKKTGNAVKRNRIKRIIRESFRLFPEVYPDRCDVVFAVRPGFIFTSPQQIQQALLLLCPGAGSTEDDDRMSQS